MIHRRTDKELDRERQYLESTEERLRDLEAHHSDFLDSSYVQQKWKVIGDRKYLPPDIRGALELREKLQKWIAESRIKIETEEESRRIDKSSQPTKRGLNDET
ncbi:MAG: hypothetical protein F4246_10915 [Rhodothermaceae bacterium]|nr:hypothetical protein [Rhodothermaceae bacterium]MXX59784.1 hypothetical protein [Rhodothermaceae bacterium]MYD19903.1 hypothetical protein [Rhodothermaceae bacterium]MYD57509.1 hypothetical protein [Rhodothermaceae bacterium]MYI44183.1 hypothetical protein [Rhodothermaceae bacterium]